MSTHPATTLKEALARLGGVGWVALVAACVGAIVVLVSVGGFVAAVVHPAPNPGAPPVESAEQKKYAEVVGGWASAVDRRSLFFVPGAPPPPVQEDTHHGAETPHAPTVYGGPQLVAMMYDTAFFQDGQRLTVGGDAEGDLKVVRLDPPWNAVVEWKKVEFTVPLFGRDTTVAPAQGDAPGSAVEPTPADAPKQPEEPKKTDSPPAPPAEPSAAEPKKPGEPAPGAQPDAPPPGPEPEPTPEPTPERGPTP